MDPEELDEDKDLFLGDEEDEENADKEEDPLSMGGFHEVDADGFEPGADF